MPLNSVDWGCQGEKTSCIWELTNGYSKMGLHCKRKCIQDSGSGPGQSERAHGDRPKCLRGLSALRQDKEPEGPQPAPLLSLPPCSYTGTRAECVDTIDATVNCQTRLSAWRIAWTSSRIWFACMPQWTYFIAPGPANRSFIGRWLSTK